MYKYWITKLEDKIFWLYLNNPSKKNAFDLDVIYELDEILKEDIGKNLENIRVLIVTSALEDIFTVGLDIKWLVTLNESKAEEMTNNLQNIFNKFENLPIPVIASIKGLNLTAGFELMLCADLIIAAENAKFGQVETKWGMTPAAGSTQRLIRFVGPLKAKELIYTSKVIDAQEALKIGLLNEVVPLDKLEPYVKNLALLIIQNPSKVITLSKQLIQLGTFNNELGFQKEGKAFQECFKSGEPKKRLKDFLSRK